MANSSLSIPSWTNGDLNAKGRSFNPHPIERFDNSADQTIFNNGAYDSQRYSKSGDNKKLLNDVQKAMKDESAALGDLGKFQNTIPGS